MSDLLGMLAPEDHLLVTALRTFIDATNAADLRNELAACPDFEAVVRRAESHGVSALFARSALEHGESSLPAEVRMQLAEISRETSLHSLRLDANVAGVLSGLAQAGVSPIVMKGIALGAVRYPDPSLRPYTDIDLLIRESEWPAVRRAMLARRATPVNHGDEQLPVRLVETDALDHWLAFRLPSGLAVECAFDPLQLGLRMRGGEGMHDRAVPLPGIPGARRLSAEDELVMLAVHANRHGYRRLLWLVDIALLVRGEPAIDWSAVRRIAHDEGVETSVQHTLRLVSELLGVRLPDGARALRPSRLGNRIWERYWGDAVVARFDAVHEGPLVFRKRPGEMTPRVWLRSLGENVVMTGRAGDKLLYFGRKLFPSRDFLVVRHGAEDEPPKGYAQLWLRRVRGALPGRASSQARKFNRAVGWNAASKLTTRFMQLFVTIVLARLLAPADFGLYGMTAIVTGLVVMFAEFGFAYALIQKLDISEEDISTAQCMSILLGAAVTGVCVVGARPIAGLFHNAAVAPPLRLASLGMLIVSFAITPRALLYRRMDFRSAAMADVSGSLVYGSVSIGMALAKAGIWSLVVGTLCMSTTQATILWIRAKHRFRLRIDRESLAALMPFGARMFAANIVDFMRGNLDYFVLGRALGAAPLGMYTIAFRTADFPRSRLGAIVGDVALPAMSSVQEHDAKLRRAYVRAVSMSALFTFPLLLGITALAPEFVSVVYGDKWLAAVPPLRVLLPMGLLLTVAQSGINILIAKGEPGQYFRLSLFYAIAVGVFASVGVRWGITGVALGVLAATVSYFAGFQFILWRHLRIGPVTTLKGVAVPSVASAAMVAALLAYQQVVGFPGGAIGFVWIAGAAVAGGIPYVLIALPLSAVLLREPSEQQPAEPVPALEEATTG